MRLTAPQIGRWAGPTGDPPACRWCSLEGGECGAHLLICPLLLVFLLTHRDNAWEAIRTDVRSVAARFDPRDPRVAEAFCRFTWPGQTPAALANCLFLAGRIVDAYALAPSPPGEPLNPAWAPYIPAVCLRQRASIEVGSQRKTRRRIGIWG